MSVQDSYRLTFPLESIMQGKPKKNLFLMTGSFALSIILFLTFTVLLDFVGYLLPQSASASDINIISADGSNSIPCEFIDTVRDVNGVDNIFGRRSLFDVSAALVGIARQQRLI